MQNGSKNGFLYLTTLLDHIMSLRKHLWMYIYYFYCEEVQELCGDKHQY